MEEQPFFFKKKAGCYKKNVQKLESVKVHALIEYCLECVVQLSSFHSIKHKYLDLQALIIALQNDSSPAAVENTSLPCIIQMLYICTGCDFI